MAEISKKGDCVKGRSQTTFTSFWLFWPPYLPSVDIVEGISLLGNLITFDISNTTYLPRPVNVALERPLTSNICL